MKGRIWGSASTFAAILTPRIGPDVIGAREQPRCPGGQPSLGFAGQQRLARRKGYCVHGIIQTTV